MTDSERCVCLVGAELGSEARARIKEIPALVVGHVGELVVDSGHLQAYVPVLELGVCSQPGRSLILPAHKGCPFRLLSVVAIPLVVGLLVRRIPDDVAEVIPVVICNVRTAGDVQRIGLVLQGGVQHGISVVQLLAGDEIPLPHVAEAVLGVGLVGLVLLIVPFSPRKVQGSAPGKRRAELMGVVQLVMGLQIIVGFIVVICRVSVGILVLPGGIVGPVLSYLGSRNALPGNAGVLLSGEQGELQRIVAAHPSQDAEEGTHVRPCVAYVSVRSRESDCEIGVEAVIQKAGTRREGKPPRVVGSCAQVDGRKRIRRHIGRAHVHARAECSRTVCGSAEPTLQLNTAEYAVQPRYVDPEHFLRFAVIQRDTVQRHIDLAAFRAADRHLRVAQARATLVRGHNRRLKGQNHGQTLSRSGVLQFLLPYICVGYRSVPSGAGNRDYHTVKLFDLFLVLGISARADAAQSGCHKK